MNMYVLIKTGSNNSKNIELVSKRKKYLEEYIKKKGYYYSKKLNRYIDDKTSGIKGGSGNDYLINLIDEIV